MADLILYTGPMFSSKTTKLLMQADKRFYQKQNVIAFKSSMDDRYSTIGEIVTHNFNKIPAHLVKTGEQTVMMQGSANYTKRNLQDYNLETNIIIAGHKDEQIFKDIEAFFETQWNNEEYIFYSTSYETYEDTSTYKNIVYRLKEFSGLSRW